MIKALLSTVIFSLFAGANQTIFLDFAGQKNGAIEKLYSADGRKELAQQINDTLKGLDDSVYFIIELPDFSVAILTNVYVREGGVWSGSSTTVFRRDEATADCMAQTMAARDVDYRADSCYYNEGQYLTALAMAGTTEFASADEFINHVVDWAHSTNPLKSASTMIEETPALKTQFEKNSLILKTTKLYSYLRTLTLKQFGYTLNLSETTGWMQSSPPLSELEQQIVAAVEKLSQDGRLYLSRNVSCPTEALPFIKTTVEAPGRLVPRNEFTQKCEGMTLMGEYPAQIVETLKAYGYSYNFDTKSWN